MNTKEQLISMLLGELGVESLLNSPPVKKSESRHLKFTDKEIMKMPKKLRASFRLQGHSVHYRKRTNGRYNCSYEIRYAKKPFDKSPITASGTTLEEAKKRFLEKLNNYAEDEENKSNIPKNFHLFSMYWFENFHQRKVSYITYEHDIKLYNRHIKKHFIKFKVKEINAVMLQRFLDAFSDRGKTAKDLYSIIKQILDCAVKHGSIRINPIGMCVLNSYDQEHGTLITKDEEQMLFETYKGTEWELPLAIVNYTGLRPDEYTSATIHGNFIKAKNSKHGKNGKIIYKYIPITPMLRPYLQDVTDLNMPKPRVLNNRFKKVLPNHKLYDMRTTFQTRCTECGINETVIGLFMGNSIGKLKEAYTDFSEDFLLKEAEKFKY